MIDRVWPVRRNYIIDQGETWADARTFAPDDVAFNFAGYSAKLDLRVDPDSPQPTIAISTVPSSAGLITLGVDGSYSWEVAAATLAALTPLQRALNYCLRIFYVDGVHRYDLLYGNLYQRRNLVIP